MGVQDFDEAVAICQDRATEKSFLRAHGLPLGELEGHRIRVLIVDADAAASDAVAASLSPMDRYEVHIASSDSLRNPYDVTLTGTGLDILRADRRFS